MGVRELGVRDRVPARGEIRKAARPHTDNFGKRISWKYPMCQLLFVLSFEWNRNVLKGLPVGGLKWTENLTAIRY
jgi:hypothetical protein